MPSAPPSVFTPPSPASPAAAVVVFVTPAPATPGAAGAVFLQPDTAAPQAAGGIFKTFGEVLRESDLGTLDYRIVTAGGERFFEVGFTVAETLAGNASAGFTDRTGNLHLDIQWSKNLTEWFGGFFASSGDPEDMGGGILRYWARSVFPVHSDQTVSYLSLTHATPDSQDNPITAVVLNGTTLSLGYPYTLPDDLARLQTDIRAAGFIGTLCQPVGDTGWAISIPGLSVTAGSVNRVTWTAWTDTGPLGETVTHNGISFGGASYNAAGIATNLPKQFARLRVSTWMNPLPANPGGVDFGQFFQSSLLVDEAAPVNPNPVTPAPLPEPSDALRAFGEAISAVVDTRLSGLTPSGTTRNVFTTADHTTPSYARNTSLWGNSYFGSHLTGVAAWKNPAGGEQFGGVMITSRHVLFCNHAHPNWTHGTPEIIRFIKADGTVVDRALIANTDYFNNLDLSVGLLDAAVPAGIHVFKIFPMVTSDQKQQLIRLRVPDVCVSQGLGTTRPPEWQNAAGTLPTTNPQMLYPGAAWLGFSSPPADGRLAWWHSPFPGDSGTARFVSHPDELLLYQITSGASVSENVAAINAAIVATDDQAIGRGTLSARTGLTLTVASITIPA